MSDVAAAGTVNVTGCMGKRGRLKGMSSVALFSSSLFMEQHTALSPAVLKKTAEVDYEVMPAAGAEKKRKKAPQ